MRYYIIAGEASGDLHASNLIKGLRQEDASAQFRFWGGDLMAAAARCAPVRHYRDTAVMGVSDVIAKAWRIAGNLDFCRKDVLGWNPDVVILVDYPGFNMKMAEFCHGKGIRVFYYIAPKTWASREGRNRKLKEYVDKLFIVFPFEREYFDRKGIEYIYRGNPLVDAVDSHEFKPLEREGGVAVSDGSVEGGVAVLAGSRKGEISRMMPVCMEVADRFPQYRFTVAGAPSRSEADYLPYIGSRTNVDLVFGRTYDVLKSSRAAIINSGTASLEAALIATPQVVCWSTSGLTFWVIEHILKVRSFIKYISLANLCLDKPIFKELIQDGFNAEAVSQELVLLMEDGRRRAGMLADYALVRESLGGSGASRAVAAAMIQELNK